MSIFLAIFLGIIGGWVSYLIGTISWCQIIGLISAKKVVKEIIIMTNDGSEDYYDFKEVTDLYFKSHITTIPFHTILTLAILFISFTFLPSAVFIGVIIGYIASLSTVLSKEKDLRDEFFDEIEETCKERQKKRLLDTIQNMSFENDNTIDDSEPIYIDKYCRKCGAKLIDEAKYCNKCGTEVKGE